MTRKSCLQIIAAILLTALLFAVATVLIIPRMLDPERYKARILALLDQSVNRKVSYESASFSRQLIPSIVITGISIKEKTGDANLLAADRLTFRLALLPLLRNEVRLREIVLERPVLSLERDQSGLFNISDLFTRQPSAFNVDINGIRINNGLVRFTDHPGGNEAIITSLEKLDLQINGLVRGGTSRFSVATDIHDQAGRAELSMSGTTAIPAQGVPLRDARLDVVLSAKNLDTGRYWPYYGRFLPFERIHGRLDIEGVFKGRLQEFTTKGSLRVRELRLSYPRVFRAPITPRQIDLSCELEMTERKLVAKSIDLRVDGVQVKGSAALEDIHGKDPQLTVRAATSPFTLEQVRSYIPYGVIPGGTADFIEQHIRGGIFRVVEGRLDGRISQILHMGQGTNYNALFVRASVDKGVMTFGPQVPMISAIKGGLEFRGKDFILGGMTGTFGGSPFSLDGMIAGYPLDTPARYPFTVSMTPAQAEVAWLLRQEKPGQMTFSGPSLLRLSGSGIAADYRISGTWDLSGADYRFPQRIHKPAGLTNRIRFSGNLSTGEARLAELHYELPGLDVTAGAVYRYDDKLPLSFTVATNQFDAGRVLPVFPALDGYHTAGKLQASGNATGDPAAGDSFRWKGTATLAEVSLRPLERIPPLSRVNGTISLSDAVLEAKHLTGRLGRSDFTVTGRVSGFSNPGVELDISSPGLHLDDLGLRDPGHDPLLNNFSASVSLKDGNLKISSLAGRLNRSSFSVQGEVRDIRNPTIDLRVNFPYLRVEDMQTLSGLKADGADTGKPDSTSLKAAVTAEAGSIGEVPFAQLESAMSLENNRLDIQAFRADAFGGTVSGSGQSDPVPTGGPLYQAQYRLEHVDAAQLSSAAGIEPMVTGQLTANGALTARGNNPGNLKKSLSGTAKVHMQHGVLRNPSASGEKIPYSVLDADLSFNHGAFTVHGLRTDAFGGTVSGSGKADTAAVSGPLYQATYHLERVDAAQIFKAAGAAPVVTGQLTAKGELTARGGSRKELGKTARGGAEIELNNGKVIAGQGQVYQVPFKTIAGRLAFERNVLTVQSARIDAFDGVISGTGSADFNVAQAPGYQVSFTSKSIDAAQVDQAFGFKSDVSGRLALKGELNARGDSPETLKKTVQGGLEMHLENGTINKFTALSRIFSILNVSQLIHLRLPDLVSTGMPYNAIDGKFSLADGISSTSDLSINSSSLNMKIVGSSDMVRKEIDLTVAVQPLQTVGKIVGRIPVIGWILTGGDRRFLVTYYKAKGNWHDPKVSSTNISTLPEGVYNIFKRTFMLPEKMITDTNKVILGN